MTEAFYGSQLDDGSWAAAAVMELRAFPETGNTTILDDLMKECSDSYAVEILAQSGARQGEIRMFLLLRTRHEQSSSLQQSLDFLIGKVQLRLKAAGFDPVILSKEITGMFISAPGTKAVRLLCVPGEHLRNISVCYCPGGYSVVGALDCSLLLSILSEHPGAGISLQIQRTDYTSEEIRSLRVNREWVLENFGNHPEGQSAGSVFFDSLLQGNAPLFFVTLSIWGDDGVLMRLGSVIRNHGYELLSVSDDLFDGINYLIYGASAMASYARSFGHVLEPHQAVPFGLERMNYLTGKDGIPDLLQGAFVPKVSDREKNGTDAANPKSVPAPFLETNGLLLGKSVSLDQNISLPLPQLTKHMVVAGMPGSGKTTLLFWIMHELAEKNISFLAIEPTKNEYRELIDAIPGIKILTPGKTDVNPVMFNPFLPPKGIALEQFLPSLMSAFQMAFSLTTPLDVIFPEVLRNCYAEYGWRNDSTSDSPEVQVFGMNEFIRAFKEEVENSDYDIESRQNLNSGGIFRLQSLTNSNSYLFDTERSLDMDRLLQGHTVIELDAIDNPEQKSLFLSLLLLQLKLVIRKKQTIDSRLKNVILIDEAHVLLDSHSGAALKNEADPSGKLRDYLLDMVKVNRAYGTGMIFADQSLAILKDFVNNSNIKVIMHVESADEREFVTRNLNLTKEHFEQIRNLKTGEFFLNCDELLQPVLVKAPNTRELLSLSSDIEDSYIHSKMNPVHEKPFSGCRCRKNCSVEVRTEAEFIARNLIRKMRPLYHDREALNNYLHRGLDDAILQMAEDSDQEKRLMRCARMMVERMIQIKSSSFICED